MSKINNLIQNVILQIAYTCESICSHFHVEMLTISRSLSFTLRIFNNCCYLYLSFTLNAATAIRDKISIAQMEVHIFSTSNKEYILKLQNEIESEISTNIEK